MNAEVTTSNSTSLFNDGGAARCEAVNEAPRMSRGPYALCFIGLLAINIFLRALVFGNNDLAPLVLILSIPLMICAIMCHVRRCRDIGKSGWFVLWLFVPIVNLFILLYLLFAPSAPELEELT